MDCVKKWKLEKVAELKGGSDRTFLRVKKGDEYYVLLYDRSPAFFRYLEIQRLLRGASIGVPEIFSVDLERRCILLEDLGDLSLMRFVRGADIDEIRGVYRDLLAVLSRMQRDLSGTLGDVFGLRQLHDEIIYFEESFLSHFGVKLDEKKRGSLFELSTFIFENSPYGFMHRDFQSQNIYLKDGAFKFIDFQNAYEGPIFYDVASLIQDPYVELPRSLREELVDHYLSLVRAKGGRELFWKASVQRLMQALAAYVFLSEKKGKGEFRRFIEPGMRLLREASLEVGLDWLADLLDELLRKVHS